jgi:hypothetical protein
MKVNEGKNHSTTLSAVLSTVGQAKAEGPAKADHHSIPLAIPGPP